MHTLQKYPKKNCGKIGKNWKKYGLFTGNIQLPLCTGGVVGLTSGHIFAQNLSPLRPRSDIGRAPLQSIVLLLASKNVAYLGQLSSKTKLEVLIQTLIKTRMILSSFLLLIILFSKNTFWGSF
jgi:hypothetical protein